MTADDSSGRLDDAFPASSMGRAAEMLGTTQGFLREDQLEEAQRINAEHRAAAGSANPASAA
ncbi:hypothetical protein [Streptomyces sp. 147326]|uniref:hypothetical protein n=1 Tax=Streptomyces sp. 147326 TaxID=3074379 RepID=UPI00385787E1